MYQKNKCLVLGIFQVLVPISCPLICDFMVNYIEHGNYCPNMKHKENNLFTKIIPYTILVSKWNEWAILSKSRLTLALYMLTITWEQAIELKAKAIKIKLLVYFFKSTTRYLVSFGSYLLQSQHNESLKRFSFIRDIYPSQSSWACSILFYV